MFDACTNTEIGQFETAKSGTKPNKVKARLSRPEPGRSLGGTVARVERPIRDAIHILSRSKISDIRVESAIFGCTVYGPGAVIEPLNVRLSWFLLGVSLTHAFAMNRTCIAPFHEALDWFFNDPGQATLVLERFRVSDLSDAQSALLRVSISADLLDLLPYLIEPHGHITRSNLENCDIAKQTRNEKKQTGVYYTPSDVADFMVDTLQTFSNGSGTWIDPACGTGVFLRSIISRQKNAVGRRTPASLRKFACGCLFGIDQSALATDLATFVVLLECMPTSGGATSAFSLWARLKRNIVCMDSLRILARDHIPVTSYSPDDFVLIRDVFPDIKGNGFDHVVMNPPYARINVDEGLQGAWHSFVNIPVGRDGSTHLAFTEMLWRLTSNTGVAAAVLPLSVGTNTTDSYVKLRQSLFRSSGVKEFLFFDREPQALFGEDIKTRNIILFRDGASDRTEIRTSRLLKWNGAQRPTIFSRDRLLKIEPVHCTPFIPKLGSAIERIAYSKLASVVTPNTAINTQRQHGRLSIQDSLLSESKVSKRKLLVGSTAYNFVNCFFSNGLPTQSKYPFSASPLNAISLPSQELALASYALLSSRVAFWLWHVEGDGFHVTGDFLYRLPLWQALNTPHSVQVLAKFGGALWRDASANPIGAVNGGKQTYSFQIGPDHPDALAVERVIREHFGLTPAFSDALDDFVSATVLGDGKNRTQNHHSKELKAA
jgi:hypothetical protein